jgi:predicted transcriptional regulator
MIITAKQILILQTLLKHKSFKDSARNMDIDELIDAVDYEVTKASIQFSLRSLTLKGVISKSPKEERVNRRGRKRVIYWISDIGLKVVVARKDDGVAAYLEDNI